MAAPLVLEQWRDVHRLLKAGKQPRLAACSAPKRKDKGNKAQKLSVPWEQANQWLSVFSNQPCHGPLLSSQNCGWETLLTWDHSSALPLGEEDGKEILTLVQSGSAANDLLFLLWRTVLVGYLRLCDHENPVWGEGTAGRPGARRGATLPLEPCEEREKMDGSVVPTLLPPTP